MFAAAAAPVFAAVNIAVVKSRDIPAYDEALKGFREALHQKGIEFQEADYTLGEGPSSAASIIAELRSKRPDLILTIGSIATKAVKDKVKDIPVVFCLVLDPVGSGIVPSMESSGSNLTGVSLDIPLSVQFKLIKRVFPDRKRIGVLFNPSENGRIITRAALDADKLGLELVPVKVTSMADVPEAVDTLMPKIDILWAVADSTVLSSQSIQYIIISAIHNGIPFVGFSSAYTKAGAVMAFSLDYRDIGRQAGESASAAISGTPPMNLPIASPRNAGYSLNLNSAKTKGLVIPPAMVKGAREVINE